jgi:hypothetical protein
MNPRVPHVHGAVKLHKQDKPIRPNANGKDRPRYKVAKYINTLLYKTVHLPNAFTVQNSNSLIQYLINSKIEENTKLCSFDIENVYTNIPTGEVKNIIKHVLKNDNSMRDKEKGVINSNKHNSRTELLTIQ